MHRQQISYRADRVGSTSRMDLLEEFSVLDTLDRVILAALLLDHRTGLMGENSNLLVCALARDPLGGQLHDAILWS